MAANSLRMRRASCLHACDGKINAFEVWMGKSEGKGPLGRQGDNINIDLRELE
jgi:hypothetical protein